MADKMGPEKAGIPGDWLPGLFLLLRTKNEGRITGTSKC
jgi:hypothetical protein